MKKILFILGSYLPNASANGICTSKVIEQFDKNEYEISVLAIRTKGLDVKEEIDGVKIYRVNSTFNERIRSWCNNDRNLMKSIIEKINNLLMKLNNIIFLPTWPLISPVYTYRLFKYADKLQKENNYDAIVSVYNPIDALVVGRLLKKKNNETKFIIYFLDSLTYGIVPKYFSMKWLENRGLKWERWLYKYADKVFIMKAHENKYNKDIYREYNDKIQVLDIPLLINSKQSIIYDTPRNMFNKEKVKFTYLGSILKNLKNPEYMLKLFSTIDDSNYILETYGENDCDKILDKYIENSKYCIIKKNKKVNHEKAIRIMYNSNFLVNIGSSVEQQIPCKIFEYMSTGKPIISFYKNENEPSLRYLRKYPLALLIKEDVEIIDTNREKLIEFVNQNLNKNIDFYCIENSFPNNNPKKFEEAISNILNK